MKNKKKNIFPKNYTISLMQFYYVALWLPVIIPLFLWGLGIYPVDRKFMGNTKFPVFLYLVLFGVLQYIVFALWTLYKYRGVNTLMLGKISFTTPISFAPFYGIGFILAHMMANFLLPSVDLIAMALVLSLLSIPVGYFYVVMVKILEWFLQKIGFIRKEYL